MPRRLVRAPGLIAVLAAASLGIASPPLPAAEVDMSGGLLLYTAYPGEENALEIRPSLLAPQGRLAVSDSHPIDILSPLTCEPSGQVDSLVFCDEPTEVDIALDDANDRLLTLVVPGLVALGDGDDTTTAGDGAQTIVGGTGRDRVDYAQRPEAIRVTLAGGADDGAAGEGDDVGPDVEDVIGGEGDDTLLGTDAPNLFDAGGGNDRLEGGGGNDEVSGSAGDDTVLGGPGDDQVDGDAGADLVDAGPGRDTVRGDRPCTPFLCGGGPDDIQVRDGEPDSVFCGIGADRVTADPVDAINAEGGEFCETIDRGQLPPPPPPPPPPPRLLTIAVVKGQSLPVALRKGLRVRARCASACALKGTARRAAKVVARGKARLARAGTKTLRLRFSRAARRKLRRFRAVRLAILIAARDPAGRRQTSSLSVRLRR